MFFGKPIPVTEVEKYADDKSGYQALADDVMRRIAGLKAIATGDKRPVEDDVSAVTGKE